MASLKSVASQAVGLNGGFSVVRDFFGYAFADSNQTFLNKLSLKNQITRVKGKSINLCVFMVGKEANFGAGSVVTLDQQQRVQAAIQHMRDIYGKAPLGIRKIFWRRIGVSEAGSFINIGSSSEAEDLTDAFSGPNDGIDTFFVQSIAGADGWSNADGPCDKDSSCGKTGAVIEIKGGTDFFGVLVAHEVGHYLGLAGGTDGANNLMGSDNDNNGVDEISASSTGITSAQANTMRSGCWVKPAL